MLIFDAIFLGIVQGLTEFLPVSSSGHLVIFSTVLGIEPTGITEVFLHSGTMLAVLIYYFSRIKNLNIKYIAYLVVGSIPAGAAGLLLLNYIDTLFSSLLVVGIALLITGTVDSLVDLQSKGKQDLNSKKSLFVGLFQALAILPGLSRSGLTIYAGTKMGISRKQAAQFSFLLSIPAIAGANLLVIGDNFNGFSENLTSNLIGAFAAFITGLGALWILERLLVAGKFKYFGYYCWVIGSIIIINQLTLL